MQTTNEKSNGLIWGTLLIAAGCFFLLQNMGVDFNIGALVTTLFFGAGSLAFLFVFLTNFRERWWAAIPATTLSGLASTIFLDNYAPGFLAQFTGSIFLASIGAGFVLVYLADMRKWWAIIPAGVLTTIAVVAGLDELNFALWGRNSIDTGGVFFLGLGCTFLAVAFFGGQRGRQQRWALIPAAAMLILALIIGTPGLTYMQNFWPLALIGGGVVWVVRTLSRHQPTTNTNSLEQQDRLLDEQ